MTDVLPFDFCERRRFGLVEGVTTDYGKRGVIVVMMYVAGKI
jgi:hypothetical protein